MNPEAPNFRDDGRPPGVAIRWSVEKMCAHSIQPLQSSGRAPDVRRMAAWLVSDRVILPDGHVRSWDNPAHPGYAYPEITGLLLSLLSHEGPAPEATRDRLALALGRSISSLG